MNDKRQPLMLQPQHDLPPVDIAALEEYLYDFNRAFTGRHDGVGLAYVLRDEAGRLAGAAAGYSWAGIAELRHMWVDESLRGLGHGRALIEAFITEARARCVRRIWVSTFSFQAPRLYEKFGFKRRAAFEGWPDGHSYIVLCKELGEQELVLQQ